jgi:hypothetical protein
MIFVQRSESFNQSLRIEIVLVPFVYDFSWAKKNDNDRI